MYEIYIITNKGVNRIGNSYNIKHWLREDYLDKVSKHLTAITSTITITTSDKPDINFVNFVKQTSWVMGSNFIRDDRILI